MLNKKELMLKLDYIDEEDKSIISKALDCAILSQKNDIYTFTDFLDMSKIHLITSILKDQNINFDINGGYNDAERCIVCFYTEKYYDIEYPLDVIEITPKINKFTKNKVSHRDYLGSILGLGISRSKIGDIVVNEHNAIVFVDSDISKFIEINLNKVGRVTVGVKKLSLNEISIKEPEFKEINTTVSSLRLDSILSRGFAISRSSASNLIKGGKTFVNWVNIKNPSKPVNVDDRITLRGYGKIKIGHIGNKTKKDRIHVTIHKY